MAGQDWDKGLSEDILALVARGCDALKEMRGVSSSWKKGYELSVTKIRIGPRGPALPEDGSLPDRFPQILHLDLGEFPSRAPEPDPAALRALPKLTHLVWGRHMAPGGLEALRGAQLQSLNLGRCGRRLTDTFSECLSGMPLAELDLDFCAALTDAALPALGGLSNLTRLSLRGCERVTSSGFQSLRGVPLANLNLGGCPACCDGPGCAVMRSMPLVRLALDGWADPDLSFLRGKPLEALSLRACRELEDSELLHLRGMPLTELDVGLCERLTPGGLDRIAGLPLAALSLSGALASDAAFERLRELGFSLTSLSVICFRPGPEELGMTDAGLASLRGMRRLAVLRLPCCLRVTDAGLAHLRGLPLAELDLDFCEMISDAGLEALREMPLTRLSMRRCVKLTGSGLVHLRGMRLESLSLRRCKKVAGACLLHLAGMPLKILLLGGCKKVANSDLEVLRGMPLVHLDLGGCTKVSDLGIDCVRGPSLLRLDLWDCRKVSAALVESLRRDCIRVNTVVPLSE